MRLNSSCSRWAGSGCYERYSLIASCQHLAQQTWLAVTPTPEQTYQVLSNQTSVHTRLTASSAQALAPDLRRKVDEARRLRLEQEAALREQMLAHVSPGLRRAPPVADTLALRRKAGTPTSRSGHRTHRGPHDDHFFTPPLTHVVASHLA
jgi:hypothetical protein